MEILTSFTWLLLYSVSIKLKGFMYHWMTEWNNILMERMIVMEITLVLWSYSHLDFNRNHTKSLLFSFCGSHLTCDSHRVKPEPLLKRALSKCTFIIVLMHPIPSISNLPAHHGRQPEGCCLLCETYLPWPGSVGLAADQVFTHALYGLLLAQSISGFRGNEVVSGGNRKVKEPDKPQENS